MKSLITRALDTKPARQVIAVVTTAVVYVCSQLRAAGHSPHRIAGALMAAIAVVNFFLNPGHAFAQAPTPAVEDFGLDYAAWGALLATAAGLILITVLGIQFGMSVLGMFTNWLTGAVRRRR